MKMMRQLACALIFLAAGCAQSVKPADAPRIAQSPGFPSPPLCDLPETFTSLEEMPEGVRRALSGFLGRPGVAKVMERRDDFYDATDAVLGNREPRFRRFIQGAKLGERYIVLYEIGGFGRSVQAVMFQTSTAGHMNPLTRITTYDQTMCADSILFLKDPLSPQLNHWLQSP